jgi:ATP-dependent exoDNAse (exonuclease V) alpha subunit
MAIYHLRATMISRSAGRSATASAAYRSAERITDRRTGLSFDYAARGGVDHTEILAPDGAPDWVRDRAELWNRVEEAETRKNSQVAREIRVALPAELDLDDRAALVRGFVQAQFVDRGMVADIALHAPGREGDERNHHAHILLTTREIGPDGFTTKNRDWNAKEALEGWREAWALESNAALERSGIAERIDHRTLEAQRVEALELAAAARERGDEAVELQETVRAVALDRPPLPQLSLGAWQLKERGQEVAAVRVWHEVKDRAVEVARVAQELAGHVQEWLERVAQRALDRFQPELALDGGSNDRVQAPDLAARLREAWEARQSRQEVREVVAPERSREVPEQDASQSLADRLREAARGIDPDALADRAAALRDGREAEERHLALEAEKVRARELEIERVKELEERSLRDSGLYYGL